MGSFRFRRSFKVAPGVKVNVNKQSLSVTTGVRGAHATYNSKGYRTLSAGLPGTGLSYRDTRVVRRKKVPAHRALAQSSFMAWLNSTSWSSWIVGGFFVGVVIGILILVVMTHGVHS
jgi:hypothetical protein